MEAASSKDGHHKLQVGMVGGLQTVVQKAPSILAESEKARP